MHLVRVKKEVNNIEGRVIGKIKGFYEVECNNNIYSLKLKGSLKKKNDKFNCVVGDIVEFNEELLVITKIKERKNVLLRPLISNIDYIALVCSIKNPDFDFITFQKNLLWIDMQNIQKIVIINKIDLLDKQELNDFLSYFNDKLKNIKVFCISIKENKGIDELKKFLKDKNIVLSGISGVGKSSLINLLFEENLCVTGEISEKTKKGKNTTVNTKYFKNDNISLFDTPGYSSVVIPDFENDREISYCIKEFEEYLSDCKFNDCLHLEEISCAVKKAVEMKKINNDRYNFYLSIIKSRREVK